MAISFKYGFPVTKSIHSWSMIIPHWISLHRLLVYLRMTSLVKDTFSCEMLVHWKAFSLNPLQLTGMMEKVRWCFVILSIYLLRLPLKRYAAYYCFVGFCTNLVLIPFSWVSGLDDPNYQECWSKIHILNICGGKKGYRLHCLFFQYLGW